jgi:hypothetical protein
MKLKYFSKRTPRFVPAVTMVPGMRAAEGGGPYGLFSSFRPLVLFLL